MPDSTAADIFTGYGLYNMVCNVIMTVSQMHFDVLLQAQQSAYHLMPSAMMLHSKTASTLSSELQASLNFMLLLAPCNVEDSALDA